MESVLPEEICITSRFEYRHCQPDPDAPAPLAPSEETAPATGPVETLDPLTGNQDS